MLLRVIEASGQTITAQSDSLTIVPPGASRVTLSGAGQVVRVFSSKVGDMLALAANAGQYAGGAPEVAPLQAWPDPVGGFMLRNYQLADFIKPRYEHAHFPQHQPDDEHHDLA